MALQVSSSRQHCLHSNTLCNDNAQNFCLMIGNEFCTVIYSHFCFPLSLSQIVSFGLPAAFVLAFYILYRDSTDLVQGLLGMQTNEPESDNESKRESE